MAHHNGILREQRFQQGCVVQHDGATHDVEEMPQVLCILQILARLDST